MGILKEKSELFQTLHQLIDLLVITIAFWLAFWLRGLHLPAEIPYTFVLILTLICYYLSLRLFAVYDSFRRQKFYQVVLKIVQAGITGMFGVIFLIYFLHIPALSRLFMIFLLALSTIFLITSKAILYYTLRHSRQRDYNTRQVLIIGSRSRSIDLIKEILKNPESGYRIYGCLETSDQKNLVGTTIINSITVTGTMDDFCDILLQKSIDEVIFAIPLKKIDNIHEYIFFAENLGINIRIMPDFQIQKIMYYPQTAKIFIDSFLGMPTMCLSSTSFKNSELIIKTMIDYIGAGAGLILLSPLMLLIALLIKLTSNGPVLFTQRRSGLNGRQFSLYKFRTMVINAEELKSKLAQDNEMDGPVFKIKKDPRVTRLGRFLRKSSLDELPQLFNILKGEMSLVGPRPPLPEEVERYQLWQRRRLSMKPGLTCIWQVSGRNDISFDNWMKMDLDYIDNWSLLFDLKLISITVKEMLLGKGR